MPYEGSLMQTWVDQVQRYFSPYDLNPFDINPLEDLIRSFVDFDRLAAFDGIKVFISATNVRTGKLTIFRREAITCRAVMASACLPMLFKAVEIDGTPFWDGGYMGNPPLFPLYRTTETEDILLVQINPILRQETPTSSRDIMNRINEITFNSSLQAELRAAAFVARLVDEGRLPRGRKEGAYKRVHLHRIALSEALDGLTPPGPRWSRTTTSSSACRRRGRRRRASSCAPSSTRSAKPRRWISRPRSPRNGRPRGPRAGGFSWKSRP